MEQIRQRIARHIRGVFNDLEKGERPVVRSPDGLFGTGSMAWRVHGDVTTMMVGGITALLLQMLHPKVLAGVWDHSNFRADMHGRLRRTARFIAMTTYGSRAEAEAAIARVREIHGHIRGTLPNGEAYAAQDPELLTWVHVTETLSFLDAYRRYADPALSAADQDRYFAETAVVARGLGAGQVPTTRHGTLDTIERTRPQLVADQRSREVAGLLLRQPDLDLNTVPLGLVQHAAIDLLPPWARRMHGLRYSGVARPMVAAGTLAMAQTVRWALTPRGIPEAAPTRSP